MNIPFSKSFVLSIRPGYRRQIIAVARGDYTDRHAAVDPEIHYRPSINRLSQDWVRGPYCLDSNMMGTILDAFERISSRTLSMIVLEHLTGLSLEEMVPYLTELLYQKILQPVVA